MSNGVSNVSINYAKSAQRKRNPDSNRGRQIANYLSKPIDDNSASELMKQAIDSERGRRLSANALER